MPQSFIELTLDKGSSRTCKAINQARGWLSSKLIGQQAKSSFVCLSLLELDTAHIPDLFYVCPYYLQKRNQINQFLETINSDSPLLLNKVSTNET